MFKIDQKITGYKVVDKSVQAEEEVGLPVELMNENLKRPEVLKGATYKINPPVLDNAVYITITDMILNEGTVNEVKHPYEVFINSRNMDNFQWILATTRLISAIWRKGGDATFFIEELKGVFDPKGGYFKRGGTYMPSIVAEIGYIIETHLLSTGFIKKEVDENMEKFIETKLAEVTTDGKFPESATICSACNTKALVLMDGCQTCLQCGASKCN